MTFGGILVLVFVSWIAYSIGSSGNKNESLKQPQQEIAQKNMDSSSFKVLPDNPGGIDVPYQDKMIYNAIDHSSSRVSAESEMDSSLLPPPETPALEEPEIRIDEYSIVDDKSYYIKIATNDSKETLEKEMKTILRKYNGQIGNLNCSIKTVRDKKGDQKYAILVGPLEGRSAAIKTAKTLNIDCSVISVKE